MGYVCAITKQWYWRDCLLKDSTPLEYSDIKQMGREELQTYFNGSLQDVYFKVVLYQCITQVATFTSIAVDGCWIRVHGRDFKEPDMGICLAKAYLWAARHA